jgi:hypothetical protein
MAIDSRAKRASIAGIITGVMPVGVTPDVAKPQAWRQSAGWGYYGILAGLVTYEIFDLGALFFTQTKSGTLDFTQTRSDRLDLTQTRSDALRFGAD